MAKIEGIVKLLVGAVTVTTSEGVVRQLQVGDKVYANDLIATLSTGQVEIELSDGRVMDLGRSSEALIEDNALEVIATDEAEESVTAIQQAILDGESPEDIAELTAAGASNSQRNEGSNAVYLDYLNPEIDVTSGIELTGVASSFSGLAEETFGGASGDDDLLINTAPKISVTSYFVIENGVSSGDTVATYTTSDAESEILAVSWTTGSSPLDNNGNPLYTLKQDGTVIFTAEGAAYVNAGNKLPPIDLTVSDGSLTGRDSDTPEVTFVNDAPVDGNEVVTINEDTPITANLLDNAFDEDGDTLSITEFTINDTTYTAGETADLKEGKLVINSNGTYTFTPAPDYNGDVPVASYTVTDGEFEDTSTLTLNITAVNDSFSDTSEIITATEDTPISGSVLEGTSSVDGPVTVTEFTIGKTTYTAGKTADLPEGKLVINSNGSYTFTPAPDYNGDVPVASYTVTDGDTDVVSNLTITVDPVDDLFTDDNEVITATEDTPISGSVLEGTSSVDGPVTVTEFTIGNTTYTAGKTAELKEGKLVINSDGSYTFTPAPDYNGDVPVASYTVTDGDTDTDVTSTLTISIDPVDDLFTDDSEIITASEDTPISGSVLEGTSSVDGPVTVTEFTIGNATYTAGKTADLPEGKLVINSNGTYTFTPAPDYNGDVPVASYTVTDGDTDVTSTLSISITPVNDSFTDDNEVITATEDTPISGSVLEGTSSVDGPVTVTEFTIGNTTYTAGKTADLPEGKLVINSNGSYTFTPAPDYNGDVPVASYTVTDGDTDVVSNLTITVDPVDDLFTDDNEVITATEDTPISGSVLEGTSSVDGPVTVTEFTIGNTTYTAGKTAELKEGKLVINSDGSYTFTPAPDYNGDVPVASYTVTDGDTDTDVTSTLTISVTPVNDSFADANEVVKTNEDRPLSGSVLSGTSSPDGPVTVTEFTIDNKTYTPGETAELSEGKLVINTNGTYTFTPAPNYNGSVPVASYTMTDGDTDVTSNLTISVTPVNDRFTDANEVVNTLEDTAISGNVLVDTSSVDGPVWIRNFIIENKRYGAGKTAQLDEGDIVIKADGSYTFTPAPNYNGPVPIIKYTVTDGDTNVRSTLKISITPVNDPFTDADEEISTNEDTAVSGSVLAGTSSVDGPVKVTTFTVNGQDYTAGQIAEFDHGKLVINSSGAYIFTPALNYNGPGPEVSYTSTDGDTDVISTLTISVVPVVDPYTDASEVVSIYEDTAISGNLLSGTSSVDGPVSITEFKIGDTTYPAGNTVNLTEGKLVINANGSYEFTPADNYNGTLPTISYKVTDGSTELNSSLEIHVKPVNDPFTDESEAVILDEDTSISGELLQGTTSPDGPVSIVNFTIGTRTYTVGEEVNIGQGKLLIEANGHYEFTPSSNYNGSVPTISYIVTDGDTLVSSKLNIAVNPVNDPFTDEPEIVSTAEDTPLSGNVLSGTGSPDGGIKVTGFSIAGNTYNVGQTASFDDGTLVINANGTYTFSPTLNFNGSVPVASYTVTDGDSDSASDVVSTLTITVDPVTDGFTDASEVVNSADSSPVVGNVLNGTSSVDGTVSVTKFTIDNKSYDVGEKVNLSEGKLFIYSNGDYTFMPKPNFNGSVPVVNYTVTDTVSEVSSTLTITIGEVTGGGGFSDASEVVTTNEDTPISGSVLNGTQSADVTVTGIIVDGTPYNVGESADIEVGTLLIDANGNYTFEPAADYNGKVPTISYTVSDGTNEVTSSLDITVTPVNDTFTDANEEVIVDEDSPTLSGDLLQDTVSPDGDVSIVNFTIGIRTYAVGTTVKLGPGDLLINADGSYEFTPSSNYNGSVPTISYIVSDGDTHINSKLNIVVNPVNDDFIDADETVTTDEDIPVTGNVLSGTSSPDGAVKVTGFSIDGGTYSVGQTAEFTDGKLVINANGTYIFTPALNFNGAVPVASYTVNDSDSDVISELKITVNPIADGFTDASEVITIDEDTPVSGSLLDGTTSVDGTVEVTGFTIGENTYAVDEAIDLPEGQLQINTDGTYTFMPAENSNGKVPTINYTLSDGSTQLTSSLDITVTPVTDGFTDDSEVVHADEDVLTEGSLLDGTNSPDGEVSVVSYAIGTTRYQVGETANLAEGDLVVNADGTYSFISALNYNGPGPSVSYTLTDGHTNIISSATIIVDPVNDPFDDASETVSTNEDRPVSGNLLTGTSSVDGPVSITEFKIGDTTYPAGNTAAEFTEGKLVIKENGQYTFTPAPNFNGDVPVVSYTVTDGEPDVISTLTINVTPVNDNFTDASESISTNEDTAITGTVLDGTTSVDGPVTIKDFTVGDDTYATGDTAVFTEGKLVISSTGIYTFTPALDYNGIVLTAISYTATDGDTDVTSNLSITVDPVDDTFTDNSEMISTIEDTAIEGSLLNDTSSVDGPVTVKEFMIGDSTYAAGDTADFTEGKLFINADGEYTFTPALDFSGPVPITKYTVTDGDTDVISSLSITVQAAPPIEGTAGDDVLLGGATGDTLMGLGGNDILTGLGGNDIMSGGEGNDVFLFTENDQGTVSKPNHDIITDFNDSGTESLNLSDLLSGEELGDLTNYLNIAESGDDVVINVNPDGTSGVTEIITLQDTSLASLDVSALASDQAGIIKDLIDFNHLTVDQ